MTKPTAAFTRALASDIGEGAPIVKLTPNGPRIIESLLFLLKLGAERKITLTQYSIVKTLFLADRASLNRVGRPITYDNYMAMKDGPVPSFTYRLLNHEKPALQHIGLEGPMWSREPAPQISPKANRFFQPHRAPDLDHLSPSDIELLHDGLGTVSSSSFSQVRRLTHEDPAYLAAWRDDDERKAFDMSLVLLFDQPDPEGADRVAFVSKHL